MCRVNRHRSRFPCSLSGILRDGLPSWYVSTHTGTARSTWGCVEKSIEISQFVTNALSCQSCGVCSAGGRSQCAPCTGSSKGSQARC